MDPPKTATAAPQPEKKEPLPPAFSRRRAEIAAHSSAEHSEDLRDMVNEESLQRILLNLSHHSILFVDSAYQES